MALIHLEQWPAPIEARKLRILEAALDAGVPFPHGCGTGECGSCKTQLISGEVKLDSYSPEALSDEERSQNIILACRARVVSDVKVRWLSAAGAPLPMVKLQTKVNFIGQAAHDVMVLRLSAPAGQRLAFHPGQFAKLRFGNLPVRSYSMASQPSDADLEFHIRIVPGGVVSEYVAQTLQTGDMVQVRGPFGDAYWDEPEAARQGPLLLLAGGTGMAPIMSVLDAALGAGMPPEQIHVYHGVRGERDLYASDRMVSRVQERGIKFIPVYSEQQVNNARQGLVHEAVGKDFHTLHNARIYVAGPPPMVDAVVSLATLRGAPGNQIRADAFYAAEPEKKGLWERVTGWGGMTGLGGITGWGSP
jgi:naphthalene 1,2-dioxygenase ferredoxin reductase component